MDLAVASSFFDNDPLYDAYSGVYLYDGQFATYDGSQLDGSFIRRRTVSLAPDLVLPPRRVVTLYGEQWVLSDPIFDGFQGETIRQTMSARKCHQLYKVGTIKEILTGALTARDIYAFARWTKSTAEAHTSEMEPYYEFSFSLTESSIRGKLIEADGKLWHARAASEVAEGFLLAEADLLAGPDTPLARVTVDTVSAIDPVTLASVPGPSYPGVLVQRYQFFRRQDQAEPLNHAGDMTLLVQDAPEFAAQHEVSIGGQRWSVIGRESVEEGFALHVRRS